jgi:hypothetical protein
MSRWPKLESATHEVQMTQNERRFTAFPLHFPDLSWEQERSNTTTDKGHKLTDCDGTTLRTYEGKILIPSKLKRDVLNWYHFFLRHPGISTMEKVIRQHFYWKGLSNDVVRYVKRCDICMTAKNTPGWWGSLAMKSITKDDATPWRTVCVDFIGPISLPKVKWKHNKEQVIIKAMTMLDPATGLFEAKLVRNITSANAAAILDMLWLARYPRPMRCVHDQGPEFTGAAFQNLLSNFAILPAPAGTRNPRSNGHLERAHATFHVGMRSYDWPDVIEDESEIEEVMTEVIFAMRSRVHTTNGYSPSQMAFGRDMILPIAAEVQWNQVQERKKSQTQRDNESENQKRFNYNFKVGDSVYLLNDNQRGAKYEKRKFGPFTISEVRNCTLVIIRSRGVKETVNIRRVIPFQE